jgi:hypothetical protein
MRLLNAHKCHSYICSVKAPVCPYISFAATPITRLTGPDWTGLICKQSGPEFWDWTEVQSYGLV